MKNLVVALLMAAGFNAHAGGMVQIPVQLMEIDNMGRAEFIKNAVAASGVTSDKIEYANLHSIVVGGDEAGSDYKGGYFIFEAELSFRDNAGVFQRLKCHQYMSVGSFVTTHPHLTKPVVCEKL